MGDAGITVLDGLECGHYQHGLRHMGEIELARGFLAGHIGFFWFVLLPSVLALVVPYAGVFIRGLERELKAPWSRLSLAATTDPAASGRWSGASRCARMAT